MRVKAEGDYVDVKLIYAYNIGINSAYKMRAYRWENPAAMDHGL